MRRSRVVPHFSHTFAYVQCSTLRSNSNTCELNSRGHVLFFWHSSAPWRLVGTRIGGNEPCRRPGPKLFKTSKVSRTNSLSENTIQNTPEKLHDYLLPRVVNIFIVVIFVFWPATRHHEAGFRQTDRFFSIFTFSGGASGRASGGWTRFPDSCRPTCQAKFRRKHDYARNLFKSSQFTSDLAPRSICFRA